MAQVVAGIVFAQSPQPVPDRPIGHDHFQPQHQIAGIAVAQHIDPARIRGQQPANPRRPFGGQRQREYPVHPLRGLLHIGQHGPSFGNQDVFVGMDRPHRPHPFQRQDQRADVRAANLSTHQPRATAIGDHGHARRMTGAQDRADLVHIARRGHGPRLTAPAPARFFQIAGFGGAQGAFGQQPCQMLQKLVIAGVQHDRTLLPAQALACIRPPAPVAAQVGI